MFITCAERQVSLDRRPPESPCDEVASIYSPDELAVLVVVELRGASGLTVGRSGSRSEDLVV